MAPPPATPLLAALCRGASPAAVAAMAAQARSCWTGAAGAVEIDTPGTTAGAETAAAGAGTRTKAAVREALERLRVAKWKAAQRKLPPELRSSRDALSSANDIAASVVEQRIQQAMREGLFDELPGRGKQLPGAAGSGGDGGGHHHADPADEMAFRILKNAGFAPDWVEAHKEIQFLLRRWRRALAIAWHRSRDERDDAAARERRWNQEAAPLKADIDQIRKKVLRYNLIAPYGRQLCSPSMQREIDSLAAQEQEPRQALPS
eukprot:SM000122S25762  [mRNA]  locus=s122:186346:187773:- [translate_table: standard]